MSAHRTAFTWARCALVVGSLLLTAAAPAALNAQAAGGTVASTAEILPPAVTGTGFQELRFGSVRPGDVVDVPPGLAGAGATTSAAGWDFGNIRKGRWVSLALTLPAQLTRGAHSIPLDWDNTDYGRICVSGNSGVCDIEGAFNPGAWPSLFFRLPTNMPGNNFAVRLFVGARMVVPAGLPPGVYSATVTSTFAYVN